MQLTETVSITEFIPGSDFTRVDGRWRLNYQLSNDFGRLRLIAEDDDQMEGDETLVLDLKRSFDTRISIISSLSAVRLDNGERTIPDTIITIVDNDFVTIALDPDEHPDNLEVAEGEELVFALTRPGDPTTELTVTVQIDEPQDADRVLEETAPFTKTVMFPTGKSTAQLTVPTVDDAIVGSNTTVTAMVVFSPDYSALPGDDEYYNASSRPASVLVRNDDTTLVTITAVGAVGLSGLVEVVEDDDVVFELTRTGDPASELTVTVAIDEPQDADRVLVDTAPFEKTVVFPAGVSTTQLTVPTFSDLEFEEDTRVTATVLPAEVTEEESGYYAAGSPGLASVLVLDDDIQEMRVYAETTQVRINEEDGKAYAWSVIFEADERPHNRTLDFILFVADYLLEKKSVSAASADDVAFLLPGGSSVDDEIPASIPEKGFRGINGEAFSRQVMVDGGLQWRASDQEGGHQFIVKDDDQMEGDETLLVDFYQDNDTDPRISIISSLPARNIKGGGVTTPDMIITIVDNDFVTIAANNPEVDEGEEIVFALTRPGDTASSLTVTVQIDEPQDANSVFGITAPFEKTVMFPANESTTQLTVRTVDDEMSGVEQDGDGGGITITAG